MLLTQLTGSYCEHTLGHKNKKIIWSQKIKLKKHPYSTTTKYVSASSTKPITTIVF